MLPVPATEEVTRHLRSAEQAARPALKVIRRRRRWPMLLGGFVVLLLLAAMLGAAVFHTQLAERQLEIDSLSAQVRDERERFDELRLERSQLRSPVRLAAEAARLGMVLAPQSRYLEVDKWSFARQLAAAGPVSDGVDQIIVDEGPFDQLREVKVVTAGRP